MSSVSKSDPIRATEIDYPTIKREWPKPEDGMVYLNTGSCGVKPKSVLDALAEGTEKLNANPTYFTFVLSESLDAARRVAAEFLKVPEECLILTQNTTYGLQMVLQSFLQGPTDELITTNMEHGCLKAIPQLLVEQRKAAVKRYEIAPDRDSKKLCQDLLALVTPNTKLVATSEIYCYNGWRPDLLPLAEELKKRHIPLLVDGAHAPGQGPCAPTNYPIWAASGHKWLGGPNGTGFLYVSPEYADKLQPLTIGDRYFDSYKPPLHRFEWFGTADVSRWLGLAAACRLQSQLDPEKIEHRQAQLVNYLRQRLAELPHVTIRTPLEGRTSGLLNCTWKPEHLSVPSLTEYLWQQHKIWTHPDYLYGRPENGLRISCHISVGEKDLDRLIEALAAVIKT